MHLIDLHNAKIYVTEGKVRIISNGLPMNELFADAFLEVQSILRQYIGEGEKRRIDVPASGNDRKIFAKVKRHLNQSPDSSFVEVFRAYEMRLRNAQDIRLDQELAEVEPLHSAPSIFRPELHSLARGPFFDGKLDADKVGYETGRYSLSGFMIRLGGYIVSRICLVDVPIPSGRPRYLTVLMLPMYAHRISDIDFHVRLNTIRREWFPGFYPEEALVMWLSLALPDDSPDLIVVGMEGPSGQASAKVDVGINVPLRSYKEQASKFLKEIREKQLFDSLKYLIRIAMRDQKSTFSGNLLKLLFAASQQDVRAAEELLLRASKTVLENTITSETGERTAHFKVSEDMLKFASIALKCQQ